ncbi:MAG: carboxypeptidase regulatory-like domain-containing protein [Chloroflexi bacterium]|nr:carboxypeptidase regulatory-like domain-containing protein [Chloroflexota bacterium]
MPRRRELYVGRRPRRRGPGLVALVAGTVGVLALVGVGLGAQRLWFGTAAVPPLISLSPPTPTATPAPTATPVPMLTGSVADAFTGQLLAGAVVALGEQQTSTGGDGRFRLTRPELAGVLKVSLPQYAPLERQVAPFVSDDLRVILRPTILSGTVRDSDGRPVAGARVRAGGLSATTDTAGRYTLADVPADPTLTVEAPDHGAFSEAVGKRTVVDVRLKPSVVTGIVAGKDGAPIDKATVAIGESQGLTGADGTFRLTNVTEPGTLAVKAGGYKAERKPVQPGAAVEVTLTPFAIKAIYLTHLTAADDKRFAELLALVKRTEINAMVIDVKGESGHLFYESKVPLAREIGAVDPAYDVRKRLQQMRAANVYAIARQVIMEDTLLAKARPELAIRHKTTGQGWRDINGIGWLNPHRSEVWDYNVAIAKEIADLGFDEVQFDYVRFPSDGALNQTDYGRPSNEESRISAITSLLTRARTALAPTGVYLAADLFGLTLVAEDDMGIGQKVDAVADALDYICPMVYPSHYFPGEFGFKNPAAKPYEVVNLSLQSGNPRLERGRARFRPWLQDFDYGLPYTVDMVRAQIRASEENKTSGWMIWNAANKYQEAALRPGSD